MKIFGLEITRQKQAGLSPVFSRGSNLGFFPFVEEPFGGAFQRNISVTTEDALAYWAVFRCISIIASDIAKMELHLVEEMSPGVYQEVDVPAFSPVLEKPNHYQNKIQFIETWMNSKLSRGNTYVLKQRDGRGVVTSLYPLDPLCVRPLVAQSDGSVFYELNQDNLSDIKTQVIVPASEIIHDRWNCLYHPLVGLSPIYAAGVIALMGKNINKDSIKFFANGSAPGGILTGPSLIDDATALRIKQYWEQNYTGNNIGKIAVLGDGLKYESMRMTGRDAQLIEQLKWTDAIVAAAFGIPAYMINAGTPPAYNNVEALTQQYYSQCLQIHIESIETCLDEGLGLDVTARDLCTEFELDDLLRMDSATQISSIKDAVSAGVLSPDEARQKLGYGPVTGGNSPYLQQQNYSLEALAKRDSQANPFAPNQPSPQQPPQDAGAIAADQATRALLTIHRGLANASI